MKTKRCPTCGNELSVSEFNRNRSRADGLNGQCKTCCMKYRSTPAGIASNRRCAKKYATTPAGRANKKRSDKKYVATPKGRAVQRRAAKKFNTTLKGKASQKRNDVKYNADPANRPKKRAQNAVAYAIKIGRMVPPTKCRFEDDTCSGHVVYHHPNYKRKLSVVPMCSSHHKRHHIKLKECAERLA